MADAAGDQGSMQERPTAFFRHVRSFLVLGRVSNLPTVWSNCLAGWMLSYSGSPLRFLMLCCGASLLYTAGMFLNDAVDATFDRQHRTERPIPSGAVRQATVWGWAWALLVAGTLCLFSLGTTTGILALVLAGAIVAYDFLHKTISFAPVLMGGCRTLLYLVAASAGQTGVSGFTVWSALVLGLYVAGVSCLARNETRRERPPWWPVMLLTAPAGLSLIANDGPYLDFAMGMLLVLAVWFLVALAPVYRSPTPNVGPAIANLLAGIVLIDLLAVGPVPGLIVLMFVLLFSLTLLLQRTVPAT